eukprot:jgi/Psemu1/289158/fgenesh1_pg.327_\
MRFSRLLYIIAAYGLTGVVSGLKCPRQQTSTRTATTLSSSSTPVLQIRGGAGSMDPTVVAKTATAIIGVQGLINVLCPEANLQFYGVNATDDFDLLVCTKMTGFYQLVPTVTATALLFYDTTVNTAIAYSFVPFIVMFATGLINEEPLKFGTASSAFRFWMLVDSVLMYGLMNDYSWAVGGFKVVLAIFVIQNLITYLDPFRGVELYGRTKPLSPHAKSSLRTVANNGLIASTQTLALLSGADTLTAIGYTWLFASTLLLIELIFGKDFEELKIRRTPFFGWLLLSFVVVGTLLS